MVQNSLFNVAEVEISYKPKFKASERPQITTPNQAHEIFIANWSLGKITLLEEFKMLLLNRRNRVLGIVNISTGGVSETLTDPKIIFAIALKSGASGIILCHNHPSEELQPGQEDINITKRLKQAGNLLGIEVLDHLIISKDSFYSFEEEGIL